MPVNSERTALLVAVRRTVPERPGVYTWLDERGLPLYVGKAINLRARMSSYLAPGETAPGARMRRLSYSVRDFTVRETEGELLALLLEDAVIKQLNPPHNERQRDYRERRYLLLTDDPYPTCLVVETAAGRSGTLFGPFKDRYLAESLRTIVNDDFGLRSCIDRRPHRRGLRFGLGLCPGPCRGAVTEQAYGEIAGRVGTFLGGDDRWINTMLEQAIGAASARLEYEQAALLRERQAFCARFARRQRFLGAFVGGDLAIAEPLFGLTYRFRQGALLEVLRPGCPPLEPPPELAQPPGDPRHTLDRAGVVYEWTRRTGARLSANE